MANLNELSTSKLKAKDLTAGEKISIADAGVIKEIDFKKGKGPQRVFEISVIQKGAEKALLMNKTSRDSLASAWGTDTNKWVGSIAEVSFIKMSIGGELQDVLMLVPTGEKKVVTAKEVWEDE